MQLARDLTSRDNSKIWAVLYASNGDRWFGSNGEYNTDSFDIDHIDDNVQWGNLRPNLVSPLYLDDDTFQKLDLQLRLMSQLGPIGGRLADEDGRVTEDSINAWLAEYGDDIPAVVADRLRFGAQIGLGQNTFGWDEIATILGVVGLAAGVVVTFVPSGGNSTWIGLTLFGLAGAEAYAAYQAGDGLGAALALSGAVLDGVVAARLLFAAQAGGDTISSADELLLGLRVANDPTVWDNVGDGADDLFESLVNIAARSDVTDLRHLADQAGDLTAEEFAERFVQLIDLDQAALVRALEQAGYSPVEIASIRRELADTLDDQIWRQRRNDPAWIRSDFDTHVTIGDLDAAGNNLVKHGEIKGAHNADHFYAALQNPLGDGTPGQIVSRSPIYDAQGRHVGDHLKYKVPRAHGHGPDAGAAIRDADGVVQFKQAKRKTVYFPEEIGDAEMITLAREAGFSVLQRNYAELRYVKNTSYFEEEVNGLNFQVIIRWRDGHPYVDNVHLIEG